MRMNEGFQGNLLARLNARKRDRKCRRNEEQETKIAILNVGTLKLHLDQKEEMEIYRKQSRG